MKEVCIDIFITANLSEINDRNTDHGSGTSRSSPKSKWLFPGPRHTSGKRYLQIRVLLFIIIIIIILSLFRKRKPNEHSLIFLGALTTLYTKYIIYTKYMKEYKQKKIIYSMYGQT